MEKKVLLNRIEKFFTPDLSFKWDERGKVFIMKGLNEAGELFVKKYSGGIKMKLGKMITPSILDSVFTTAGKLELCYEIEDTRVEFN